MGEEAQNVEESTLPVSVETPEIEDLTLEAPTELVKSVEAEEKMVDTTEAEEKTLEAIEDVKKEGEADSGTEVTLASADESALSYKEDSYYVKDLKESEKKALQDLKEKIDEAVKANTFFAPPKQEKKVEEKVEESTEAAPVVEASVEEPSTGEAVSSVEPPLEAVKEEETIVPPSEPVEKEAATKEETIPNGTTAQLEMEKTSREVVVEDESPSLENLALWGVPLLPSKGDERTDVILLKFLRARDFKVKDALNMLKETLLWRKEFQADSLINEEIATSFDSVAYMHGFDREGHPVCYNHYGIFQDEELYQKTFGDEAQFKNFLRWRIQLLEKSIQKLDFGANGVHSILQITDMKDSPGFVKRKNITKKALTQLQDNYPELVAKQIFINVPWYFGALYSLHGKIVTPRSKSKVVVARPGKVTETLFKYITPEQVPVQYGGLSRPNDTEFEGVEASVKEVIVKPGEKQTIELLVEVAGSTVVWDFALAGWEVVYGEEFVPNVEGSYTVIIQKPKKVAASEEPVRNSFLASEPGKIVLTIDNTASRKKRLAIYRHLVKKPDLAED